MEVKKDIGKALKEKLESLERQPDDALWDAISKDLHTKKKKQFTYFLIYIYSLPAIVCILYMLFCLSSHYPTSQKQDSVQMDIPEYNQSSTLKENTFVNNETFKDSSAERIADTKNDANNAAWKDANASHLTNRMASARTAKENRHRKDKNKKYGSSIPIVIKNSTTLKNKEQKNNSKTTGYKHNTHISGGSATGNTKIAKNAKTRNKSIKYLTALHGLKTSIDQASGNSHTKSGNTINASDNYKQPTDKQNITGNDNGNTISENSSTTANRKNTASEIITIGKISLSQNDSLTENIPVVKDSLKTELSKEVLAEEKERIKKDSLAPVVIKRFSVFAYGGPSFFNFPERKIVTDSTSSNITTKSATRFGVLFGYRLNNKLSIRTGLSVYKLKQSASKIKLSYYMDSSSLEIYIMPPPDFDWIDYKQPFETHSSQIINTLGENYNAIINIDRELRYLEIPLEIGYNLIDKKFGMNLFGGGSLLLLTKNEVFAYNENGKMYLGKWNAAAKTSLTGTLGLGLHYNFSPSLQLNAEPMLNYNFTTYKDSKPYSLTIRLGMQYNFDIPKNKK